jgi:rhamnogalacturonan endolyase
MEVPVTRTKRLAFLTAMVAALLPPPAASAQYVVENLGRGVIAIRASENTVYIGWRLLGTDPSEIGFNVYRASGPGAPVKLNNKGGSHGMLS